ncbi:MAG: hypothetical protein JO119_18880, partial [Acidobacteria bacterium]|nr:hypothetical protein [Acidobacteriota bacterium]
MTTAARPGLRLLIGQPVKKMQGSVTPQSVLGPQADDERERIRRDFETGVSARQTVLSLCALADQKTQQVFEDALQSHELGSAGLCLVALGGYGRRLLFPYSDLDILFLFGTEKAEQIFRPLISDFSRTLWDMGFRVSSAGRTLEECKRIEEDNIEFHLALLDRRFLVGDSELFNRLDTRILPTSEKTARPFLLAQLHKLTKDRLNRYGNTIFHLEPNVKDAPGGLRDYQAAVWLRQIAENKQSLNITAAEEDLASGAVDFLSAIRCFLHYANGRNDNTLTYELQAAAAERSLGVSDGESRNAAEWMRLYFRHARTLNRLLLRYLEQKALVPQTFRQRFFNVARGSKTEPTNGRPFGVRDGMFEVFNQPALSDRSQIFSLFTEAARAGIPLSRQAERCIAYIMQHPELPVSNAEISWNGLREMLGADYPGFALRPM